MKKCKCGVFQTFWSEGPEKDTSYNEWTEGSDIQIVLMNEDEVVGSIEAIHEDELIILDEDGNTRYIIFDAIQKCY
jgi:hypothetical protein